MAQGPGHVDGTPFMTLALRMSRIGHACVLNGHMHALIILPLNDGNITSIQLQLM